jgi:hypothetical protein
MGLEHRHRLVRLRVEGREMLDQLRVVERRAPVPEGPLPALLLALIAVTGVVDAVSYFELGPAALALASVLLVATGIASYGFWRSSAAWTSGS